MALNPTGRSRDTHLDPCFGNAAPWHAAFDRCQSALRLRRAYGPAGGCSDHSRHLSTFASAWTTPPGTSASVTARWLISPMRLTPVNSPFFANTSYAPGQLGSPYSFSLSALNGRTPLTFTVDTGTLLPGGVTLSSAGLLSGTPTAAGNFQFYYHVTDADGNVRYASTSISIYPAGGPIGINTQAGPGSLMPSATVNARLHSCSE